MKKITIAIDGYSSCGKSTMAKDLAKEIGYVYVDTGAMYRSVTLYALRHQLVREALVAKQQKMGEDKGIVMDGRDIGTTVFPNAELKIFVTASSQVRAQRRFDELKEKGMPADFEAILKNVEERDYIDTHRETSPLRKADDAITLDNSEMTIPEQKEWLMKQYQKAAEK